MAGAISERDIRERKADECYMLAQARLQELRAYCEQELASIERCIRKGNLHRNRPQDLPPTPAAMIQSARKRAA